MIQEFLKLDRISTEDPVDIEDWEEIHPSELVRINPLSIDRNGRNFYQYIFPTFVNYLREGHIDIDVINVVASLWKKKVPFETNYDLWSSISEILENAGIENDNIISGFWFIEMTKSKRDLMLMRRGNLQKFLQKCTDEFIARLNDFEFLECLNIFFEKSDAELPLQIYNSLHTREDYAPSITAALIEFYKEEAFSLYPEIFVGNHFIIAPCFENHVSIPHNILFCNTTPEIPFIIIDTGDKEFSENTIDVLEGFNPTYQNENGETPLMAFIKKFGVLPKASTMRYDEELKDSSGNTWQDLMRYVSVKRSSTCKHVESLSRYADGKLYCEECAPENSQKVYYDRRCPICYEEFDTNSSFVILKCDHIYCRKCGLSARLKCPQCCI